jgi:tRNA(Ile)-lysidine synthase
MHPIEKSVFHYLERHNLIKKPLLLALSGGVDSMALYHVLKSIPDIYFKLIHINHGLREESRDESRALTEMACQDGIKIHIKKIQNFDYDLPNLEDRLRNQRYSLFKEAALKENVVDLLLAHHFDDADETAFKRILEGASLLNMGNFLKPLQLSHLTLHRPLLAHSKDELIAYIAEKGGRYFFDKSNDDLKILRNRMRKVIFPQLESEFGKKVKGKFAEVAAQSLEVVDYLEARCAPILREIVFGPVGLLIDFSDLHLLEIKYILIKVASKIEESLTKTELKTLIELLSQRAKNKRVILRSHELYAEAGRLFIARKEGMIVEIAKEIKRGSQSINDLWKGEVYFYDKAKSPLPYFLRKRLPQEFKGCIFLKPKEISYSSPFKLNLSFG